MRWPIVGILLGALGLAFSHAAMADEPPHGSTGQAMLETASGEVRQLVAWVIESEDNHGLPFMVVDKRNAETLAFDPRGLFLGAAAVLLGVARGDDSAPGIGERALKDIPPEDRTTPAGRFTATLGTNLAGTDILWIDYNKAISLHRVITGGATDQRLDRLATPTADDNRISYGCINVPVAFYELIVRPLFTATAGIVYILPETRSIEDVFFTSAP
jgi:hypothetical protein